MRNKQIAVMLVIILITLGGYFVLSKMITPTHHENVVKEQTSDKKPTADDEVTLLLKDLKKTTGINFSVISLAEFGWNVGGQNQNMVKPVEVIISGKGYEIIGALKDNCAQIEDYFKSNGFEVDMYNLAAGTVGSLTGYKKNQIVCTMSEVAWLDEENMPLETLETVITVKCGIFE